MSERLVSRVAKNCIVGAVFCVVALRPGIGAAADRGKAYDGLIAEFSSQYAVEAALVKAVIRAESGFDSRAVSPRGARGLMQIMPRVARKHGAANPEDPRQNIRAGVRLLRTLLDRFENDTVLALAAYNAGSGAVERGGRVSPSRTTRRYVETVLRFRDRYRKEAGVTRMVRRGWPPVTETIRNGAGAVANTAVLRTALQTRRVVEPARRFLIP
jgi:hypothetical protein